MPDAALPGLYTSLPRAKAPKAPKAAKGKKPCKYGPRTAAGLCPKKPRAGSAAYGDATGDYRTSAQRKSDAASKRRAQKAVENVVVGAVKGLTTKQAREAVSTLAGLPVKDVLKAGKAGAALLSTVALAGIAAYEITKYVVTRRAENREQRAQQAYEMAIAYRNARAEAQRQQRGKALSAQQQRELAAAFKSKLAELGFPVSQFSTNLKGL